ncbi:MAG: hypothetical protein E7610_00470 [Ruminococcaceae bacterium]|nr:hypothetical protein [Oscillospiraceae bacterium]
MNESMKNRALNAFAAMGTLPDAYILSAEEALYEAEAGIYRSARPMGPVRRFLNSGWGAAVVSGIVALTVLILIIRAGQNPPTSYPPPVPPTGSSIEMSDEGVNFTIATEQESYPEGMNRFTVIMTGKNKGEVISMHNAWYLERLTDEGAVAVEISYTEEAIEAAEPGRDEYAVIDKHIYGTNTGGGFMPGTYRLHATKHDGEKYVSVAWCEFTVEEAPTFRKSNYLGPFKILSLSVDSDANTVTVEVEAIDPMTSLVDEPRYWYIQRADGGSPNASLSWYVSATSEERFALKHHNGDVLENGGYARFTETITLQFPEEWIAGAWISGEYTLYALTEPLKEDNEYFASAGFTMDASKELERYSARRYPDSTKPYTLHLMANGTFRLIFGAVSSRIGLGTYEMQDGYLYLNQTITDEVWVFEQVGDDLAYREDLSRDSVGVSSFPDGLTFYREYLYGENNTE